MAYSGNQNDPSNKYAKPAGALLGVGGAVGIKKSLPYLTGRRSFWHGTSQEHAEKILSGQGIRPSAKTGATGVLSTEKFIGEGYKFPQEWRKHAYISESPFKSGIYSAQSAMLTQSRPRLLRISSRDWGGKYGPKLIENPETAGGSQVMAKRIAENYTGVAKRIVEKNPEMIQSAHKMQTAGGEHAVAGISARRIVGAKGYQKLTGGEIFKYAKARPLRFLGGAGGAAIGAGAIVGGGALAMHKRNRPTTKNLSAILDAIISFS